MADINSILRRSSMVDTSGSYAPSGIQVASVLGGGVYTQAPYIETNVDLHGYLSLGLIGGLILLAVGFYFWTKDIQGGG